MDIYINMFFSEIYDYSYNGCSPYDNSIHNDNVLQYDNNNDNEIYNLLCNLPSKSYTTFLSKDMIDTIKNIKNKNIMNIFYYEDNKNLLKDIFKEDGVSKIIHEYHCDLEFDTLLQHLIPYLKHNKELNKWFIFDNKPIFNNKFHKYILENIKHIKNNEKKFYLSMSRFEITLNLSHLLLKYNLFDKEYLNNYIIENLYKDYTEYGLFIENVTRLRVDEMKFIINKYENNDKFIEKFKKYYNQKIKLYED